jgi:hypothetical protein
MSPLKLLSNKQEALENIRRLLNGERDPHRIQALEKTVVNLELRIADLQKQSYSFRQNDLIAKVEAKNLNYDTWEEYILSQYKILKKSDLCWTVESYAREWKDDRVWDLSDELECKEKIFQLMNWRYYDDFLRKKD